MSTLKQVLGPNGEIWATAPDESWQRRGETWPEPGVKVEGCWASRFEDPPRYEMAPTVLVRRSDAGLSIWANERGQVLIFNPDFWRPLE